MGSVVVIVNPKYWLFAVPLVLVPSARAQEDGASPVPSVPSISTAPAKDREVSVEELVAQAIGNSPQLPIARENLEAARQRAGAARVLLNPTLQAVPRLFGSRQAADTEIVVSQPLDVFGKRRVQAGVFTAQVRGAQAAQTLAERTLIVQVKNAAAGLFAAQEAENLGVT
ncbi:MAG: hypothetical protein EON58_22395, partial [Alphaproteobacteria bacterium]